MRPLLRHTGSRLHKTFIKPRGKDADSRRREFILNTMLSGLLAIATIVLLYTSVNFFVTHVGTHPEAVWQTLFFWLVTVGLVLIARLGSATIASVIFFAFLLFSGVQFALAWGFGLAIAELVFAMTIVIAGVLFRASLALLATGAVALALFVVTILQVNHLQHPATYWRKEYVAADAVGYIAIFIIIGLVSWLSNRETDRSLKRARRSERALQKERDNLEITIADRTRQLEDLQLARLLEMQRFAEFGRIGASLVHEITNPLTAASLHLEQLNKQEHSDLVKQVKRNLNQLERYLLAARKQIKRESRLRTFAVGAELRQVMGLVTNRAHSRDVKLEVDRISNIKLYGDPVKFNQLVANLISNAIDASAQRQAKARVVTLHVTAEGEYVVITVSDEGMGISAQNMEHLFEPFYSTKHSVHGGLGIGLAMVKQYVEHDFRGSVEVVSVPKKGTTFTVRLRSQVKK